MGQKASVCLKEFGTALSIVDLASSCFWGCRGGDHIVEYLGGRVSACARAAFRLILFGFYDESLSLTRSIGEIAHLLLLFNQDANALSEWKRSDKKKRMDKYSPHKVRVRLEAMGLPLCMNQQLYRELCEVATHPTPQTKPQAHNPLGIPSVGGTFQEVGALVCLNELASATAYALIPFPKLLGFDEDKKNELREVGFNLLRSVGQAGVLTVKDFYDQLWRQTESQSQPKRPN